MQAISGKVIGAYQQLLKIEKSLRMAKSDLKARPIFHRKKDSIDSHLTILIAVVHELEQASELSSKRMLRRLRK